MSGLHRSHRRFAFLAFAFCLAFCRASHASSAASLPTYQAYLVSSSANTCMSVPGAVATSGLVLSQASCTSPTQEFFAFLPQTDGTYVVHSPASPNLCMDLNDSGVVVQNYCLPTASQKWLQTENSNHTNRLTNQQNGLCLVLGAATESAAAELTTAKCDSATQQEFGFGFSKAFIPSAVPSNRQLPVPPLANPVAGTWQAGMFKTMPYRILFPVGYDPSKHVYPIVLFLHGAGERGTDNQAPLNTDLRYLASDLDFRAKAPLILVAPQCPADDNWGNASSATPTNAEALAVELMEALVPALPVDPARVSVTGLSMGGLGAWDVINRYPKFFAAAAPLAGAGNVADASSLVKVPILAVHGSLDTVVPVTYDEQMYATIHALKGAMIYYELAGVGHDVWDGTYTLTSFWQWLFAQKHS